MQDEEGQEREGGIKEKGFQKARRTFLKRSESQLVVNKYVSNAFNEHMRKEGREKKKWYHKFHERK